MELQEKLCTEDSELQEILLTLADAATQISSLFHPENRKQTATMNSSGDMQMHMDIAADNLLFDLFSKKECVKEFASEERETVSVINNTATYSVTVDPLDGSSLLDVNLAVGTILGIWRGNVLTGTLIGAAYIVYGPTTIMIYSLGKEVCEFLLEKDDFILVQENIKLKEKGSLYSSGGLSSKFTPEHRAFVSDLEQHDYKLRYSGGLVPDVHQILLKGGGVFMYPALTDAPKGKLRLLFELMPFAFIIERAGGSASDGLQRILDIPRKELHQKSAFYIGSFQEVEKAKRFLSQYSENTCTSKKVFVPADVPAGMLDVYTKNYLTATKGIGRLFLFAGDQKIEHLNDDFFGPFEEGIIPLDDADPEHLFRIASSAKKHIGVFASQYGLIAKYGRSYSDIPYLVKMNSKSHLVKTKQAEPVSSSLVSFEDVLALQQNSGLNIVGIGYTIYVGSAREDEMFAEAGRLIAASHRNGMLVVLWIYPRGLAVPDEKDPHIIAGAAGVACCLGADFVKVNYCKREGVLSEEAFKEAVLAAGRTQLI
ncbi:hypothetical protein HZA99_06730, partial [Candidatus Woesearchaeota archaeon]|nr:hypothetical protein [Candidatus Woesearchaeota archaeon]